MSNQDKREVLEMIADAVTDTHVVTHAENSLMSCLSIAIKAKASSLPEDKPEREMPKVGERVLWLSLETNRKFEIFPAKWGNTHSDRLDWEAGLMFSDLDIALAEKKCAELNEILRR